MGEENNNNENKVVEEGKKLAKQALREGTKEARKKIIAWALPVIGWAALILLAIGALNLIAYEIKAFLFGKTTTSNANDVTEFVQSLVTFGENGEYKLNKDYAKELIEDLEKKSIDTKQLGYITSSGENMIDKYIKVDLQMMLPKTDTKKGDFDGLVKIQRVKPDGSVVDLQYKSYKKYEEDGKNLTVDEFSIDPKTFKLLILGSSTHTVFKDINGNVIDGMTSEDDRAAKVEEVDYQTLIQNYGVPFNFLLTLHSFSQDTNFMNAVLDKILEEKEPIILSCIESSVDEITNKIYTGSEDVYERQIKTLESGEKLYGQELFKEQNNVNNGNIKSYTDTYNNLNVDLTWAEKITTTITRTMQITKAETWLISNSKKIEHKSIPERQVGETNSNDLSGNYSVIYETIEGTPPGGKTEKERIHRLSVKEEIITTTSGENNTLVDLDNKIKVDDFVELIKKFPQVHNNLITAPSNIFYMLEESENTQTLAKIMRYVLFKLSGTFYGVSDADLDGLLDKDKYKYISSRELLKKYIRYWEYSLPQKSVDGSKYIIYKDASGKLMVGYGVDVEKYKDLFISEGYSIEVGAEVDVNFVDKIEDTEIQSRVDAIETILKGLKLSKAQINALVLRSYDFSDPKDAVTYLFGNPSKNFTNSYIEYWNNDRDNKYKEKITSSDFSHKLYKQYMSKSLSSSKNNSIVMSQKRRESEWKLFELGYYDVLGVWDPSANSLLEAADQVHTAQITWTYSVGGDLFWEDIESSLNNPNHVTCCATFVSSAMYVAGLFTEQEMNNFNYNYVPETRLFLERAGWKKITSYDDLEPGDIVITNNDGMDSHVQLYAGDNTWYNAGSTEAIQRKSPYSQGDWPRTNFQVGLRVPN